MIFFVKSISRNFFLPGEKASKSGHENNSSVSAGHTNANTSQILFANEAFNMSLGVNFSQFLRKCGVFHVSIQTTNSGIILANLDQGSSISLSSGKLVSLFVIWRFREFNIGNVNSWGISDRSLDFSLEFSSFQSLQMGQNFFSLGSQCLAMPVHLILNFGEVPTLVGLGQDHGGLALSGGGLVEGFDDLVDVVPVDNDGVEAEAFHTLTVLFHVMFKRGGVTLTKSVYVNDGTKVVQFVITLKI